MNKNKIVIATRGSRLALAQANWVRGQLTARNPDLAVDLSIIKTKGDKILDVPLAKVGGKGLFVKEIEDALLAGEADLAVHSMKDVPAELPDELYIAVVPEREDCRDALLSRGGLALDELPAGTTVGTSSLRRQAQLLRRRPDLTVKMLRGNVDTRLRKLDEGEYEAIVLAAAGLARMGFTDRPRQFLGPDIMIPAIGQGALGIEIRKNDTAVLDRIAFLHHPPTAVCVTAERAFLKTMEGGCQVPLGALARLEGGRVSIVGMVADVEGRRYHVGSLEVPAEEAEEAGRRLAKDLLDRGGREILRELYQLGNTQ